MQQVPLTYHQAIFDLLGVEPRVSPKAQALIAERERVCGTRFPASIKEWFSLDGAAELFSDHTNADHLAEREHLGNAAGVSQGWLHVATENQGVVAWFARLDGSDDPPVYHNNDMWDEDRSKIDWQLSAATFTAFLFGMIMYTRFTFDCHLYADDKSPTDADLDLLRRLFQEGPPTGTGDWWDFCFFNRDAVLTITRNRKDAAQARWTLKAGTPEHLYEQAQRLLPFGTLAQTLAPGGRATTQRLEAQVVERLRSAGT